MNPLQRIEELEKRVAALEGQSRGDKPQDSSADKPVKRDYSYPSPLTEEAKQLVLFVWECLDKSEPVTIKQWAQEVANVDTDGVVPNIKNEGNTLRALLAEQAGLKVVWSKTAINRRQS